MALSVIGAGFGRTGTESMKTTLEILGFEPCHHMKVLLSNPAQEAFWRATAPGETSDLEQGYAGYNSGVDWPTALYWRELAELYPQTKILLTRRPADAWYDSAERTLLAIIKTLTDPDAIGLRMINQGVFEGRLDERNHAIGLYEKHNAEVAAAFDPDRLLAHELGDGWAPLCKHLGRSVPDQPFPRSNAEDEFHEFFGARKGT